MQHAVSKGLRIRDVRLALGLTAEDFGIMCRKTIWKKGRPRVKWVTSRTVFHWEADESSPDIDVFDDFPALGINMIPYILGHDETRFFAPVEVIRQNVRKYQEEIKHGKTSATAKA